MSTVYLNSGYDEFGWWRRHFDCSKVDPDCQAAFDALIPDRYKTKVVIGIDWGREESFSVRRGPNQDPLQTSASYTTAASAI